MHSLDIRSGERQEWTVESHSNPQWRLIDFVQMHARELRADLVLLREQWSG